MSRLLVSALLLVVGCKATPPQPLRVDHQSQLRNPVQLSWQEVRRDDTHVDLVARVQRLAPLPFPIQVSMTLPPGATLTTGRARFVLPPNAEGSTHEEALTVAYARTPEADLELAADGQSADIGIHAGNAYRFGRTAPTQEVVAPQGSDVKIGNTNLGPSIPIGAQ